MLWGLKSFSTGAVEAGATKELMRYRGVMVAVHHEDTLSLSSYDRQGLVVSESLA